MNEGFCEQITPDHQHSQAGKTLMLAWWPTFAQPQAEPMWGCFLKMCTFAQNGKNRRIEGPRICK